MEKEQKRYTKDEYVVAMSEYIGQEKSTELDALSNHSSTRIERLTSLAGKFGTLRLRDGYVYRYHVAADGLQWAAESGRLSVLASMALRQMKVADLLGLLWEISEKCRVIGDVPHFVNGLFRLEL